MTRAARRVRTTTAAKGPAVKFPRKTMTAGLGLLAAAALLAACAQKETILQGERLDIRAPLTEASVPVEGYEAVAPENRSVPIALSGAGTNAEWTHRGGNAQHHLPNPALGGSLTRVWTTNIGAGNSRKTRITADPVVAAGRVYAMDAQARVTATSTGGGAVWAVDLTPSADRAGEASSGGLAYGDGRLYVTTGFGELVALDAATGAVVWRQKFDAAVGGAPAVAAGHVFVVARDASAWAMRASDGKVAWSIPGSPAGAGVMGVSAPASDGTTAVFPFAAGQMTAADIATGEGRWTSFVAGRRLGRAFAAVSDLTGDPVIAGGTVYAGSAAGRLAAVDLQTGQRLWAADDGAVSPVAVAGGSVFLVSDEARLMRLDAGSGETVWAVDLPYHEPARKERKRRDIFVNYGPILAGGRLVVASTDGTIRSFDPASGATVAQVELPGGAASAPVVAGGTLYVVSRNGQLHAFR